MASYTLIHLFSPLGLIILALLLSFVLSGKKAKGLLFIGLIALYFLSTPYFAQKLYTQVFNEAQFPVFNPQQQKFQQDKTAIVVLGAGRYPKAREYNGSDVLSNNGMNRVRLAVKIQQETSLPILVSGAAKKAGQVSEAVIMETELKNNFHINTIWLEDKSQTTAENALLSAKILKDKGIETVILVTTLQHMPRAYQAFKSTGLEIIPAATRYYNKPTKEQRWLSTTEALERSTGLWYELLAQLWYKLKT